MPQEINSSAARGVFSMVSDINSPLIDESPVNDNPLRDVNTETWKNIPRCLTNTLTVIINNILKHENLLKENR